MSTTPTSRYVIDLTNPDDINLDSMSLSSGRYGFTLRAQDMDAAIAATIARAKAEGIYGYDWIARIQPLNNLGHRTKKDGFSTDVGIRLRGDGEVVWRPGESGWGLYRDRLWPDLAVEATSPSVDDAR